MAPEADTKTETTQNTTPTPAQPPKSVNPATVKKAIALGKEVRKQPEKTKADAARAMYELIAGEPSCRRSSTVPASRRRALRRASTTASAR